MRSSDENGGSKLLYNWSKNKTVIQLHLDLAVLGVGFTMDGVIAELGSGFLHLVGAEYAGAIGADCEATIHFEEESLEVKSENTLRILLKNGETIFLFLSTKKKLIPE